MYRPLHRAAKRDPFLQPKAMDSATSWVQLRPVNFIDIDEDFSIGALLQVGLQFVDLGSFTSNNDSRARGVNRNADLISGALNLDQRNSRMAELFF
jgi:hypothetical protein